MEPVLAEAAKLALASGVRMVDPGAHELACAEVGVGHDEWFAALGRLRAEGLIQLATGEGSSVSLIALTNAGLLRHLAASRPDLGDLDRRLAAAAAEAVGVGPVDLAGNVGEPALLVECLLDRWVIERRVVYSAAPGRRFRIHKLLPGTAAPAAEAAAGEAAPTAAQP